MVTLRKYISWSTVNSNSCFLQIVYIQTVCASSQNTVAIITCKSKFKFTVACKTAWNIHSKIEHTIPRFIFFKQVYLDAICNKCCRTCVNIISISFVEFKSAQTYSSHWCARNCVSQSKVCHFCISRIDRNSHNSVRRRHKCVCDFVSHFVIKHRPYKLSAFNVVRSNTYIFNLLCSDSKCQSLCVFAVCTLTFRIDCQSQIIIIFVNQMFVFFANFNPNFEAVSCLCYLCFCPRQVNRKFAIYSKSNAVFWKFLQVNTDLVIFQREHQIIVVVICVKCNIKHCILRRFNNQTWSIVNNERCRTIINWHFEISSSCIFDCCRIFSIICDVSNNKIRI